LLSQAYTRLRNAWDGFNRYLAPWIALAGGLLTALLWREGVDHVRAAVVLACVAGLSIVLLLVPPWRRRNGARPDLVDRVRGAAGFVAANLAQNVLWFCAPLYVLSTTWTSGHAAFTLLLAGLCLLSCFDRVLHERVLATPRRAAPFVGVTALAALQLFLPLLTGLAPRHTIFASGAGAALLTLPLLPRDDIPTRRMLGLLALAAVAGAVFAWLALPWLPPAPLRLVSASFALARNGLDPASAVSELPVGGGPAYVFFAIEAPLGLHEVVRLHVSGDHDLTTRPLEIEGGRAGGYRLWAGFEPRVPGRIHALVRTAGGQVVGEVSIDALEAAASDAGAQPAESAGAPAL
jgi:hypothetical protein